MATVRITDTIRNHVRNKIVQMFRDRFNDAHAALQALPIADAAYEQHYGRSLLDQVDSFIRASPKHIQWFEVADLATVNIVVDVEGEPDNRCTYSVRSPFRTPRAKPNNRSWYEPYLLPKDDPIYPAALAAVMEIKNLEAQQKTLEHNLVNGVLVEYTTLRQVLELWPTAMEFMSDEVKKRHAEPTVKRGSSAKPAEVSAEVKAALMTARMLSTNRS